MGRRLTRSGMLSALDAPELQGLSSYLRGSRWLRDAGGHGTGGSDDDEEDDEHERTDDDEDDDEDDDKAKAKSSKGKKKSSKDEDDEDDDEEETIPRWKYDRLDRRMRAADKRSSDLQAELDKLKADGGGKLDEETKREINDLRPKVSRLEDENQGLRLRMAVLTTPIKGVEWVDPEDVIRLVDLDDVDIDDKGKIDKRALTSVLKDLAKRKPHLVKKVKSSSDDDEEDIVTDQRSGPAMNGKRKGQKTGSSREQLASRFPVLRGR